MENSNYYLLTQDAANKVVDTVNNERNIDSKFDNLLSSIEKNNGQVIFVGGYPRNIVNNRRAIIEHDIDIIVTGKQNLNELLRFYKPLVNSFGGYKVSLGNKNIDIWNIEDHWYFKTTGSVPCMKDMSMSALYNVDSIFVNYTTGEYVGDNYNKAVEDLTLDFSMPDHLVDINPNKAVNVFKATLYKYSWALEPTPKVGNYIYKWFKDAPFPLKEYIDIQVKRYGHPLLHEGILLSNALEYYRNSLEIS